ncbi:MAG: hypothetical protein FWD17_01915 [Polyangiaceae bacterium]|nr:hypothetical protein [Polyangiaceae bacterium]
MLNADNNAHNFICFDSRTLSSLALGSNPNATVEEDLKPGANQNHIFCSTINAQKSFDFTSCVQTCVLGGNVNPMTGACPDGDSPILADNAIWALANTCTVTNPTTGSNTNQTPCRVSCP